MTDAVLVDASPSAELVGSVPVIGQISVSDGSHIEELQPSSIQEEANTDAQNPEQTGQDANTIEVSMTAEAWALALSGVARQLEYYLSVKNLSKDIYVQTLRKLNDGCVPLSILANFAKVKQILSSALGFFGDEQLRSQAVWEAASHHSNKLRVVLIDTKTGKQVTEKEAETLSTTILAVGTLDNNPIADLDVQPAASSAQFANALVLRDVSPKVTEEEIQALFQYEGCPSVTQTCRDVSNCWFVYLDTTSRSDVINVLLHLRSQTLDGSPVHARIKTSVASAVPIDPAPAIFTQSWQMQEHPSSKNQHANSSGKKDRKKQKKRSNNKSNNNKKKNSNGSNNNKNNGNVGGSNKTTNSNNANSVNVSQCASSSSPSKKKALASPPPAFGLEDFPSLVDNRVEWESALVQDDKKNDKEGTTEGSIASKEDKTEKIGCDSVSTETTVSSSSEHAPKKFDYAAVLKTKSNSSTNINNMTCPPPSKGPANSALASATNVQEVKVREEQDSPASQVYVMPPGWGGGRSFADILR